MEVETINPETINSHQPNIEQMKPSIGLPPILKPPKHQAYPGKATIKLIQQMSSGADIFNKRALFSIRQTHNNKKYLQQYQKEHNRQRSETQLDVSNQKNHKKHPIFLSAKNNKLKLPKPVVVNNNLKTLKEQFKLREESIERFLTNPQVLQKYKMLSHLGKGSFSIVSLAINKESNQRFAIKTYAKVDEIEDYKFDNIYKEINHLAVLAHQNIVCLYHVIKDKRKILLIMQDGGKLSLAGLLRKNKTISQIQAKNIFKQILIGIKYCHDNKICHRDIKLENILINDHNIIKIIDFGFSSKCGVKLQNYCGTPPYMAPEITYKVPYFGQPADMWALGILLYLMLHGKFPFRANSQKQLYRLIQQGKLQFGQGISSQAKQIITKLLKCNLHDRLTAQKAMQIAWLN